jgi:general secretion pathway protein B
MSYILEALKKSKQERNDGESEDLYIVHGRAPAFSNSRWVQSEAKGWIYLGIFFVIIVCSASYIYWYEEAALPEKPVGRIVITKDIEIRSQIDSSDFAPLSDLEGPDDTQVPVVVENNPYIHKVIRRSGQKVVLIPTESEEEKVEQRNIPRSSAVIERKELPAELQSQIPPMKFAGHTYADEPKQRMIIINNKILREGDSIDGDTKLVEIIWEGVILDYKGVTFKQQLN